MSVRGNGGIEFPKTFPLGCDPARFVSKYAGNINVFDVATLVKKHEAVCTTTQTGSYGIADVDGHVGETANQPCSHNMGVIL